MAEKRFSEEAVTCEMCLAEEFTLSTDHEGQDKDGIILDSGKFEGEVLAAYHAYHIMLDGFVDEEDGAAWLIGNMICEESESGFVCCDIYDDDATARYAWERSVNHAEDLDGPAVTLIQTNNA